MRSPLDRALLANAVLYLLGVAQAGPISGPDGSYVELGVVEEHFTTKKTFASTPALVPVPKTTVLVSRTTAANATFTQHKTRSGYSLKSKGTPTMPIAMKADWEWPQTTTAPEFCTLMSCTTSSFTNTVILTDQCFRVDSTWRCSKTIQQSTTCVDYAKPQPGCAFYTTSLLPVKSTETCGLGCAFGMASPSTVYDKTPTPTMVCVSQTPSNSPTCTSWCSYSSKLRPNQWRDCATDSENCYRTTSTCVEALPRCLYVTEDAASSRVCIPPTMVSGACSTTTYYSPTTDQNGATGHLTTSTCIFADRPIETSSCFFSNGNSCVPFSEATKSPRSPASTITPGPSMPTSTRSCAYGTTTFPFTWKLCDQQPCATSSSTVVQCKELFQTGTSSISWSPMSSSSTTSQSTGSRTRSATVTPTISPGDQKIEINVDDSVLSFLTRLTSQYCQGSWCENALIHSEIISEVYLEGFTSDEVRNRGLKNLNEHVLENDNATQWWATNAMADYIAHQHAKGQALNHTIYIDEMLQGLESEKLAEYREDDGSLSTTAGSIREAPTLTPVCMLTSGTAMATSDVLAFASALRMQFEQMAMKPTPTGRRQPCNAITMDYYKDAFCHCTKGTSTKNIVARTKDWDACGGYTAWPSNAASVCTDASCMKAPVTTGYTSPTAPVPVSLPSCAPGGKPRPLFNKGFIERSIEGFCNQRMREKFIAQEWAPDWRELTILAYGESNPPNSDLSLYMHYEKEACLIDLIAFDIMPGNDYSYCKDKFSFLLNNCTAVAVSAEGAYTGGGYYSDCMWWEIRDAGSSTKPETHQASDKNECTATPCVTPIPTKGYTSPTAAVPIETPRCESYGTGWQSTFFDNSIISFCHALVTEHWNAAKRSLPQYMHYDYTIPGNQAFPEGAGLRLYIHFEEQACWPTGAKFVEFNKIKQNDYQISEQTCKETFRKLKNCREAMVLGTYPKVASYWLGGGINSNCLYWRASWAGTGGKNVWPDRDELFVDPGPMDELTRNVTRAIQENMLELEAAQLLDNGTNGTVSEWVLHAAVATTFV